MTTATRLAFPVIFGGALLLGAVATSVATPRDEPAPRKKEAGPVPQRIEIPGVENAFRLSPRLYSGGDPHGVESLTAMKKLGVRTIVSVDGAAPDVEAASKLGLRYVHLPIGYDGVPREQAVKLVKAVKTLPGPIYIHCHHGKHRGPAAAAVCGMAVEGWTKDEAVRWMEAAGTAPAYRGLYDSARAFVVPSAEELARPGLDLPERSKIPALVGAMIQVDGRWDRLQAVRKAGFKTPPDQPDLDPPHEALQFAELFRELARLPEAKKRGKEFLADVDAVEKRATALERSLRSLGDRPTAEARKEAEAAFEAIGKSCTACHARHRDGV